MRRALTALVLGLIVILPRAASVEAWGFDIHRFITEQALLQLPAEIRPFFQKYRGFVVEHSVDPDLWRTAGFEVEPPRHFLDLDAYGDWPFAALPRDFDVAVAKFGRQMVEKNGTLPWRVAEIHGELTKSFAQHAKGTSPWALDNVRFFAAVLAHYVGDAHVPFHAVVNYDGQLSNQHGIHSRFETELFLRYRDRLRLSPPRLDPVRAPAEFIFDTLLAGFKLTHGVFQADLDALGRGDTYDDAYFDRFFARTQPVLEQQVSRAIAGVAASITGAWEAAGKPELPLVQSRPVRKKRASTSQP